MYVCNNLTSLFSLWLLGIKQIQESEHGVLKFKNTNSFCLLESTDLILSDDFYNRQGFEVETLGQRRLGWSGETGWVRGDWVGQRKWVGQGRQGGSGETGRVTGDRVG